MQLTLEVTGTYLEKFREIEAAAPDSDREVAHSIFVHEAALYEFAKRELAGDANHSLDEVIGQLQWPIAPPA